MVQVRVVTDSGADLSPEIASRLEIAVVPLVVRFGNETFLENELSSDAFWAKAARGGHPGTSQPSVGAFDQVFAPLVDAGHLVLCLTLTSVHSGTYSTATVAARRFGDRVRVVDTQSLSMGQGFQVLAAAEAAMAGATLDQVTAEVTHVRERTRLYILLDTIEHLRRGGRADLLIPALSRVAQLLRIKPVLNMVEGQLSLHALVRTYRRGLSRLASEICQLAPVECLAVLHVRCAEGAHKVARALAEALDLPWEQIYLRETGAALSTHGGPGVVGVAAVAPAHAPS